MGGVFQRHDRRYIMVAISARIGHSFPMKVIDTMNCLIRWHQTLPACGYYGVDPEL
jgi:hypothetical protein